MQLFANVVTIANVTNVTNELTMHFSKMMSELFPKLEKELENFINYADKLDGL